MKRLFLIMCALCSYLLVFAQGGNADVLKDIQKFQDDLKSEYKDSATSPLKGDALTKFKGIHFFPVNLNYVVQATFVRTPAEKTFKMPTSGAKTPEYVKYGQVTFTLLGKQCKLGVYQSLDLAKTTKYKDYLVILFKDQTSGKETYGGGRYIDLTIPTSNSVTINFNKAYHPYCAYAEGYNCPIPPAENYLPVRVEAGVRF